MNAVISSLALLLLAVPPSAQGQAGPPASPVAPGRRDTTYLCVTCHAEKRTAFVQGVHAEAGIRCHDCHGGNPRADSLPAAHAGRFLGKPTKIQTVALCGSCHADPDQMRPFGLPSGEMAEFATSRHGKLLLQSHDTLAPTCIDCHDAHTIRRPDDARSNVYPTNIPATCGRCHDDQQRMAKFGIPTDQGERFRNSAHGIALLRDQNFEAPACIGCHGSHSALPPRVSEVATVCSRCHVAEGDALRLGAHAAAARSAALPGCLGCHSNHDTERIPADRLAASCTKCHAPGTRAHGVGVEIEKLAMGAQADLDTAEQVLNELALAGRQTGDARFRYQTALTAFNQIAMAQHELNLDRLEDLARQVRSISRDIGRMQETANERRWEHKLFLVVVWFLALSAMALSALALRRLDREEA